MRIITLPRVDLRNKDIGASLKRRLKYAGKFVRIIKKVRKSNKIHTFFEEQEQHIRDIACG